MSSSDIKENNNNTLVNSQNSRKSFLYGNYISYLLGELYLLEYMLSSVQKSLFPVQAASCLSYNRFSGREMNYRSVRQLVRPDGQTEALKTILITCVCVHLRV